MKLAFVLLAIVATVCCEVNKNFVTYPARKVSTKADSTDWWKTGLFYQIYPRSFKDDNNDGYGDLAGIKEKLDFLVDTGITGVWLSPIFASPQVDQGYDISDYRTVDPVYGTNEELIELIDEAHEKGLKIILDFVPNHSSNEHEWFILSENRTEGYEDYYTWANGTVDENGERQPPNNWVSLFKGSAWTWSDIRQQYYLHQFASAQPDLNYRNERLVNEMKEILRFWLDNGVDGFRVDAVPYLFEDEDLRDEPLSNTPGYNSTDYEYLDHIYTQDLEGTYQVIYDWRAFLDNYTQVNGGDQRIMMTEAYTNFQNTLLYFRSDDKSQLGAHFSFNFDFISYLNADSNARTVATYIWRWMDYFFDDTITFNWVLGNHDNSRVATRFGVDKVDGFNMLTAILPGIQVTYNGEEIGQENGEVTCDEGQDPQAIDRCEIFDEISRDFERTPYQWDDTVNAGFNTGAKTWLPVSYKYNETNLAFQNVQGIQSHYNVYKALQQIRTHLKENHDGHGMGAGLPIEEVLEVYFDYYDENVLTAYVLIFNLSEQDTESFSLFSFEGNLTVVIKSENSEREIGDIITSNSVTLGPNEALVLLYTGSS